MILGKRIKEQRKLMGLTQKELGEIINVTKVSICCYEKGTRTPTLETLKVLAETFNVDINYLLGNDSYQIAEENSKYGTFFSKEEIVFIKELRKNRILHERLIDNPKRFVELINKKVK